MNTHQEIFRPEPRSIKGLDEKLDCAIEVQCTSFVHLVNTYWRYAYANQKQHALNEMHDVLTLPTPESYIPIQVKEVCRVRAEPRYRLKSQLRIQNGERSYHLRHFNMASSYYDVVDEIPKIITRLRAKPAPITNALDEISDIRLLFLISSLSWKIFDLDIFIKNATSQGTLVLPKEDLYCDYT